MTERAGPVGPEVVARLRPDTLAIRRGGWAVDLRGPELAEIGFDGVRLLRGIRPVVRDQDWNTVPVRVDGLTLTERTEGCTVVVELTFADGAGIHYAGRLDVSVEPERLEIRFTGRARSAFRRNRIGLVVLHPLDDAGRAVDHRTSDGNVTAGRWPERVSPHQPFRDVAGFGWARDHVDADLRLDGDVFETEDQRNWTDASFKTYSTPLDRPFPVDVAIGDTVEQGAVLQVRADRGRVRGAPTVTAEVESQPVVITDLVRALLPEIAVGASAPGQSARPETTAESSPEDHAPWSALLVELVGGSREWDERLRAAAAEAHRLGIPLDVRAVTDDPAALTPLLAHPAVRSARRLTAFDPVLHVTTAPLWRALVDGATAAGFTGALIAGTRAHFTELNRQVDRLPTEPSLTFSITPQMHTTEVAHIVDSLGAQRVVAAEAVRLAGGRPVHIGPITLRQRFNAVATTADAVDPPPDPLQRSAFAGAWALGSVAALTRPGVAGLSYFTLGGDGGLRDRDGSWSAAGTVLVRLAAHTGRPVLDAVTPSGIVALPVDLGGGRVELFLANLTERAHRLQVFAAGSAPPPISVELPAWAVDVVALTAPHPSIPTL